MADPKIKYDIEASVGGEADVQTLERTLRSLGDVLEGELAEHARAAADALQDLGGNQAAVATFTALRNETSALAVELAEARTSVQNTGARLEEASTAARGFAQAELDAKAALAANNVELAAAKAAQIELQASVTGSARRTDEYRAANAELTTTTQRLVAEQKLHKQELKDAEASSRSAVQAENALSAEFEKSAVALNKVQSELDARNAALDASGAALRAVGVDTDNLSQTQRTLETAIQGVRRSVQSLPADLDAATLRIEMMADAEKKLAGEKAFEAQHEAAKQLVKDAEYVRAWTDALDAAERQQRETAAAAEKAAEEMRTAFATVGVKSAQTLEAEIAEVRRSLELLKSSGTLSGAALKQAFAQGEISIAALQRELREVNGQMTLSDRAAKLFSGSIAQISAGNIIADGFGMLVNKVQELGRAFIETIVQTEQMRRGLNAIYGSATTTASQMAFLMRTALSAGVAVGDISKSFISFSAATKSSNISLETTNALFAAVTRAAGTLGLSGEEVSGMLMALSQMASKGVVSMEELRQQLGERLPGALSMVAQGFGITEAALIDLVSSGQLAARDLFPALTKALNTMKGEVTGLAPAWENLKTVMTKTGQVAGDAGWTALLSSGLKALTVVLGLVVVPMSALMDVMSSSVKAAQALGASLRTLTSPVDALSKIFTEAKTRQTELFNAFLQAAGISDTAAAATKTHADAMQSAVVASAALTAGALTTAQGQSALALAIKLAGDSSLDASKKYIKLSVELGAQLSLLDKQTLAAEKNAKATQQQGATLVEMARLRGDEAKTLEVSAKAAAANAAAMAVVEGAQRAQIEVLQIQRDSLIALANTEKDGLELRKQQIESIDKKILASKAEAGQALAAAEAAKQEALQRRLAVETMGDQSREIDKLRAAREVALLGLANVIALEREGFLLQKDVDAAQQAAAAAVYKYNDALRDKYAAMGRVTEAIAASNNLEQAGLTLQMAQLQAAESKARADGNEYEILKSLIAQKELEIKIVNLSVAGKIAESNAQIALIQLKQAELDLGDPLYAQKLAAYDLSIKSAEAAILQAKATGESVAALERELKALKEGNTSRSESTRGIGSEATARRSAVSAADEHSDALERLSMKYKLAADYSKRQVELLQEEIAYQEKLKAIEDKRLNRDKEGYSLDTGGKRVSADVITERSVYEQAKSAGLTDAQALKITNQFVVNGEVKTPDRANAEKGETSYTLIAKAINELVMSNAKNAAAIAAQKEKTDKTAAKASAPAPSAPSPAPAPTTTTTTTPAPAPATPTRSVNIQLSVGSSYLGDMTLDQLSEAVFDKFIARLESDKQKTGR